MKGYVKFSDGHMEEILNGFEFDDACYPKERHYIMVETRSGSYRKTINKKTGKWDCCGFMPMPGYTHPVNLLGHNGVVDIVVDDRVEYSYVLENKGVIHHGTIRIDAKATMDEVKIAVLDEFERVTITKLGEE